MADVLQAATPYRDRSAGSFSQRAKVDFLVLEDAKLRVRALAEKAGIDFRPTRHDYPHFFYIDDKPKSDSAWVGIEVSGDQAVHLLNIALSNEVDTLKKGETHLFQMLTPKGAIEGAVTLLKPLRGARGSASSDVAIPKTGYLLTVKRAQAGLTAAWLRALSDGYVVIDLDDLQRKAPGPAAITVSKSKVSAPKGKGQLADKPFYIGMGKESGTALPDFVWNELVDVPLKRTALFEEHVNLGAKIVPFAGWEMPLRYSSVREEHLAVRQAAGLFDVTHMGVYDASGPQAVSFLDSVTGADIAALKIGESIYTHFLDPDASVIDDLLVYRLAAEHYLIVVNASNDDKNWAWLTAVKDGKVCIDRRRPWSRAFGRGVRLRNLRDAKAGNEMRVDIALQGPKARKILLALEASAADKARIRKLKRFGVTQVKLGAFDLILSRTGYTGESMSFELFVHPQRSVALWQMLLKAGEEHGLKPCGLGARDSLRIEAGLPLYGQELAGPLGLSPADAGFRTFVKTYKPWFIGRDAFLQKETKRTREIVRFRFPPGVRMAHLGDPVTDPAGKPIGEVTSCSLDSEGTLTGQAWVEKKAGKETGKLLIYQGMHGKDIAGATPTEATILSRMM
jgi:glycine hydroxymethyltransferase